MLAFGMKKAFGTKLINPEWWIEREANAFVSFVTQLDVRKKEAEKKKLFQDKKNVQ